MSENIKVCTYDNPDTMTRECWCNGELRCHYDATLVAGVPLVPPEHFFFGANIGPWKTGQYVGDMRAVGKQ